MSQFRSEDFHLGAILCVGPLLWAGNFVIGRSLHDVLEPFQLNFLRWAVAGVFLFPVALRHRRQITAAWATHTKQLLVLAILSIALFNWLVYTGLQYASASTAGVTFSLSAVFIVFIAWIWRGAPLTARDLIGAAIALVGAAIVIFDDLQQIATASHLAGPAMLLGASITWSVFTVCLKRWSIPLAPQACLAATVLSGLAVMTPVALITGMPAPDLVLRADVLFGTLYLGVGASIVAFCAWQSGVARAGAARAGIFLHLVPVFSICLGFVFLDEALTLPKLLGTGVVLLGILFSRMRSRKTERGHAG
ncbi:DMT family transporter [Lutimaribacter saemankumensis]|uniref:Threonine/homoserine efflux transporter RhtA n=1 Tax=Lutimaribacter saemankumensis TaxID=490829 RepID=A0A1G8TED7_9RHOB|nr:DMT family transporter [Lutimaribacter saemankumensis]SDJ39962.1 Threonine/homoserine efflux transporter RhtA [Lutimaribacter saemankumensis]